MVGGVNRCLVANCIQSTWLEGIPFITFSVFAAVTVTRRCSNGYPEQWVVDRAPLSVF